MSSKRCPICSEQFESGGAVRDHAWDQHGACHYCGEQPDGADQTALYRHWLLAHPADLRRVDEKQARSAVDSLSFGERLSNQGVGAAVGGLPRRYVLAAGGATAALGIAGTGAVLSSGSSGGPGGANSVDEYEYAVLGGEDTDATITYFGSYKCPHCADFNRGLFRQLHAEYVATGDLAIRYRNLSFINGQNFLGSDAENPGHAGLAVYNNEPESYRAYHDYIFENQPAGGRWATADRLTEMAREAGVSEPGAVRTAIQERQYLDALDATDQAAQSAGVDSTPAVVIDGQVYNPLGQPSAVQTAIENVIG